MKSSSSIIRGHLRPIGARSPPFLLIGLLVILGILGFNYWNLSYEYDGIIKEIAELQDHLRMAVVKKETADKQSEALEKRFREAEHQLSKVKITADLNHRELTELEQKLEAKNAQLQAVKTQLDSCQTSNMKLNSTLDSVGDLQKKTDQLENEKIDLRRGNEELSAKNEKLKSTLEDLEKQLISLTAKQYQQPNVDPFNKIPAGPPSGNIGNTPIVKDGGQPQQEQQINPEKLDKNENKIAPPVVTLLPPQNLSDDVKEVPLPVNEEIPKTQNESNEANRVDQPQTEGIGAGYGDENEVVQLVPAGNKMEIKDAKNLVQKELNASQVEVQNGNKTEIPVEEKIPEKVEGILQPPTKIAEDKNVVEENKEVEEEPVRLNPNIPKPNNPESNLV